MTKIELLAVMGTLLALTSACGSDDDGGMTGSGGASGSGASSGAGGNSGSGGSSATGGGSGSVGSSGNGGMSGDGNAAGPLGKDNAPTPGAQIDRMGRPAVNTALIHTFDGDAATKDAAKDEYNAASDPATWAASFQAEIRANLAILDALDATCGNQLLADASETRYDTLASVLADDQLYVNTASGTCGTYLGVEAQHVGAVTDGGCGGRTPNDDVIDRSYSVLAAGILTGVDDTITADDATHSTTDFPFLAE